MTLALSAIEARVIASLVEKSITTPQYYPLSVNALAAACNQKSSRDPLMNLGEGEIGAALNRLEELRMVKREDQISRVPKWRHRFNHELLLKDAPMAVLAVLMLRGPQTLSELRANAAALNGPADIAGVRAALEDLADRAQPLIAALARQPGQSAQRYTQLICPETSAGLQTGPVESVAASAGAPSAVSVAERVAALEARVAELEARLTPPTA